MSRTIRNLALVGFMGTGKSTIGRLVADQLRFQFADTDDLIEEREGRPIKEIFKVEGEPAFRKIEQEVIRGLEQVERTVVATGGGTVINPENLASLKTHALVVCLWASPEAVFERVKNQSHRPLLQQPDPLQTIRELLARRDASYRQADVLVNTELRPVREVAAQVIYHFSAARAGR